MMDREQEKLDCTLKFRRYVKDRLTLMFDDECVTPPQFVCEIARAWSTCEHELRAIERKHAMAERL